MKALASVAQRANAAWLACWVLAAGANLVGYAAMELDPGFSPYWGVSRILTATSFEVVGLLLWRRRPDNPVGPLLFGVGLAAMATYLVFVPHAAALVLGWIVQPLPSVLVAHALVIFPDGRFHHRGDRLFVWLAYAVPLCVRVPSLLVSRTVWLNGCEPASCVASPLLIRVDSPLAYAATDVAALAQIVVAVVFLAVIFRRVLRANPSARRAYRPSIAAIAVLVSTFALHRLVASTFVPLLGVSGALDYAQLAASLALPMCLAYGLVRARPNVADLVTKLERCPPEKVGELLAAFLGDPTLQVAVRRTGGDIVDLTGRPVDLSAAGRARTIVDSDTSLLHDPALFDDRVLLDSVTAAARLVLDKARLQAEVRAQLRETQESRARLAHAALAERRRIERDLHDGTQQRLIAVGLSIEHARRNMEDNSVLVNALDEAAAEVVSTLAELRELARGLRPALLVERGLAGALPALVRRTPLPVRLDLEVATRLPDTIEATAYFVVSEALTNVVKHAKAEKVRVSVGMGDERLRVEVADDGNGGADQDLGSGLRGLADRVAAMAGVLTITSPVGAGTVVTAEIPMPSDRDDHMA